MGNVISIPLEKITLSKTNPRKHFDPAALADLAENIKIHGVLQPILVRPDGKKHQLVVGERRFRASQKANLKTIPAITKKLTDEEAFELGMIENLQREDLSEIEEARGYRYMLDKFGYKAEDLAEKINKSRAYIYGRLKLANLCKKGQKALEKGEINASTGLLVARIPGKEQQEKALQEVTEENYWEDTMSYREAKKHIEEHYMVRLKGCGFSTKDEKLIPKAGPCTTCPKRTGNQKELYPNTSADVCTDPECFRAKKDAQTAILIEQAKAKGKAVLTGKDAEKHMEYGRLKYNSPLVDLQRHCYEDSKGRNLQQLLGKDSPEITLLQTEEGLIPTVKKREAEEVLKKKFKWARESGQRKQRRSAEEKRETRKRMIQNQVFKDTLAQVGEKAKAVKVNEKLWLFLAQSIVRDRQYSEDVKTLVKRREIPYKKEDSEWRTDFGGPLLKHLEASKGPELRSIIFELIVRAGGHRDWSGKLDDTYKAACTIFDIDWLQIEKDVKLEFKAKEKAKAKKKTVKKKAKKKTKLEPVNLEKIAS